MRLGSRREIAESASANWKLSIKALSREIQNGPREATVRKTPSATQLPHETHTSDCFVRGASNCWVRIIQEVVTTWEGPFAQPCITLRK